MGVIIQACLCKADFPQAGQAIDFKLFLPVFRWTQPLTPGSYDVKRHRVR